MSLDLFSKDFRKILFFCWNDPMNLKFIMFIKLDVSKIQCFYGSFDFDDIPVFDSSGKSCCQMLLASNVRPKTPRRPD